jgi:hypothetical protein
MWQLGNVTPENGPCDKGINSTHAWAAECDFIISVHLVDSYSAALVLMITTKAAGCHGPQLKFFRSFAKTGLLALLRLLKAGAFFLENGNVYRPLHKRTHSLQLLQTFSFDC